MALEPLTAAVAVRAWQVDGPALLVLALLAVGYLGTTRRPNARADGGWPPLSTAAFLAGIAVAAVATCGWPGVYGEVLFWVHMVQHLLLIMVAPALLCAGRPLRLLRQACGPVGRRRLESVLAARPVLTLTAPPVSLALYAAVLAATHLTGLMDQIMLTGWLEQLEHVAYLVAGYLLFVPLLGGEPVRWRLGAPAKLLLLVVSMAIDTFVGIVLMMQAAPVHTRPHPGWGPAPHADTMLGGAIMWFGGDGIMAAVMIAVVADWLLRADTDQVGPWLERARANALAERLGRPGDDGGEDEDSDARLEAYNAWLARLAQAEPERSAPHHSSIERARRRSGPGTPRPDR